MHHVLAIDDDVQLCQYIQESLKEQGLNCTVKHNAESGIFALKNGGFDIIILDVMMSGTNGIDTAIAIRNLNPLIPIIFLSSQTNLQVRLDGLRTGADDYMTKPFSMTELALRINSILRRTTSASFKVGEKTAYPIGSYVFDHAGRTLTHQVETILLSHKEASLLQILCEHKNAYVQREKILTYLWNKKDQFVTNSMDVYISRLRKLLRHDETVKIENLHGTGFRIVAP